MRLKRAGIITKIVILALVLYAIISLVTLSQDIVSGREEKSRLEAEVARLQRDNAALEYEIEHSGDDATIESIARSKLGLVRPGEKIFYDISR